MPLEAEGDEKKDWDVSTSEGNTMMMTVTVLFPIVPAALAKVVAGLPA
jgi:uncharacterized membrane protein YdjX (TVP38/TMEM64 family)